MMTDFLPNIRGMVSHDLHEKGESQRKIAQLLGITQARVSYYLRRRKTQFSTELSTKFGISTVDLQNYSRLLAEDVGRSRTDGIFTLYSIWKNLLFNGLMCATHQKESDVPLDCSVCMQVFKPALGKEETATGISEDAAIIRDITRAVSMLESSVYFPNIMPEVAVNVAMSRTDPKTINDVGAVPGRINKIHGRAKAFVTPEFGSSNHMSKVLLIANSKDLEYRAVMNIKYDDTLSKVLDHIGIPKRYTISTKGQRVIRGEDQVLQRLTQLRMTRDKDSPIIAVVDRGSEGVEPMTYLLGKSASDLTQAALKIALEYSKKASAG
ncbi:MAG: hypothetical protein JRN15_24050 [Nitrososphaerota archaeon]|nr:hypothetical protein [Nitrososphaerota archaeon]